MQRFNPKNQHNMSTKLHFTPIILAFFLCTCAPSPEECATQLLSQAQTLVDNGSWRQAMILLDSVHATYPRQVQQRRIAKALSDSITYLEAQSTMAYTDTLLPPLLEQADKLIKQFRYEKNEKYEQHGRYVHRLLTTSSNTARNFIQAYVRDDRQTIVKSYYYGNSSVDQQRLVLQSDGEQQEFAGSNHHFQTEGHHEIMTLEDEQALALLNFISAHMQSKVRVEGIGNKAYKNWVYYLNDKEKEALSQTYQLGWLMKDIKRIEQMQQVASKQIMRYEQKKEVK